MYNKFTPLIVKNVVNYFRFINFYLEKKISTVKILLFIVSLSILIFFNISDQSTDYGRRNNLYEDSADSYSHYIVRNSIINDLIGYENKNGPLILTKKYSYLDSENLTKEDFNYYNDNTILYTHSRTYQRKIYTNLIKVSPLYKIEIQKNINDKLLYLLTKARIFPNSQIDFKIEIHLQFFRYLNTLILSIILTVFAVSLNGKNNLALIMSCLMSLITGITIHSSNLYVPSWPLLIPLLYFSILKKYKSIWICFFLNLIGSYIYFSSNYLFAATFGFLSLLPIILLSVKENRLLKKLILITFFGFIVGFFIAVYFHVNEVSLELNLKYQEAISNIFESASTRIFSLYPMPFGISFFKIMLTNQLAVGFKMPLLFTLTKSFFLFIFIFIFLKSVKTNYKFLFWWGFLTYLINYIFNYSHMMHHNIFDTLLFGVSIQLSLFIYFFINILKIKKYVKDPIKNNYSK
jgi:hypothetical protein